MTASTPCCRQFREQYPIGFSGIDIAEVPNRKVSFICLSRSIGRQRSSLPGLLKEPIRPAARLSRGEPDPQNRPAQSLGHSQSRRDRHYSCWHGTCGSTSARATYTGSRHNYRVLVAETVAWCSRVDGRYWAWRRRQADSTINFHSSRAISMLRDMVFVARDNNLQEFSSLGDGCLAGSAISRSEPFLTRTA